MNVSALCTIFVRFGPLTPEFLLLKKITFTPIRQKSAYYALYLGISWTNHYQLYRFDKHMGGDDYRIIPLAVADGTLLW